MNVTSDAMRHNIALLNNAAFAVDASRFKNAPVKSTATSVHTSNALPVQRLIEVFTCRARLDSVAMSSPTTVR